MTDYKEFLKSKLIEVEPVGVDVPVDELNPALFDWQKDIVRWALMRGRAALFEDCGLGKTPQQLEWSNQIIKSEGGNILILAPLAVSHQTKKEGKKFNIDVNVCKSSDDIKDGINITNYERLHHFRPDDFTGIVLDESSILKSYDGKTRKAINDFTQSIKYRLACTATPAPNDLIELVNHAEFLDIMRGKEIIALFFRNDGNTTHSWRLKGHAASPFWQWMSEWSVALRKPSDLGYDDGNFVLPPLNRNPLIVESEPLPGDLFVVEAKTLLDRRRARKASLPKRVKMCANMVNNSDDYWIVWCDLNAESEALTKAIPDAVEIRGSHSPEYKEEKMNEFSSGNIRVLVSKPSICGWGMNWQHCHKMAFVGLSDSFESLYQATRRCWRFGQKHPVDVYVITGEAEGAVVKNIERKEKQASDMFNNIVKYMNVHSAIKKTKRDVMTYTEEKHQTDNFTLYLGDSCEVIKQIEDESIGLSVFSPPFPGMYAYTNSERDIGNTTGLSEMIEHFNYMIPELLRITMPGRMCCIHLCQLTAMKNRDGYIGLKDYRGEIIKAMEGKGFRFAGEVTIDKNPQIQATRNKERGLLFKSLATDSAVLRMALADYLIYFRKDGDNPFPIKAGKSKKYNNMDGWITEEEWIEWASPVWYRNVNKNNKVQPNYPGTHQRTDGISETNVLNVRCAREDEDERHMCPLQLGVIERAVKLWSAPGDTVFSPFMGIGSEGYIAVKLNRKFIGIELKPIYYQTAIRNIESAIRERDSAGQLALI